MSPGSAARPVSAVRHVTDCGLQPCKPVVRDPGFVACKQQTLSTDQPDHPHSLISDFVFTL